VEQSRQAPPSLGFFYLPRFPAVLLPNRYRHRPFAPFSSLNLCVSQRTISTYLKQIAVCDRGSQTGSEVQARNGSDEVRIPFLSFWSDISAVV
jgi:hypothetical protein